MSIAADRDSVEQVSETPQARRRPLSGIRDELRSTRWPGRRDVTRYTVTVLGFLTLVVSGVCAADAGLTSVFTRLFGN